MNKNELISIVKNKLDKNFKVEDIKIEDKSFLHKNHVGNQVGKYHLKITLKSSELSEMSKIESNKILLYILNIYY